MKKTVTKEARICDSCEKNEAYCPCLACGQEFCYECRKSKGIEYKHAVHFSGSGDGFYCYPCNREQADRRDPLMMAYRKIANLRDEETGFYNTMKARSEAAQKELESIRTARGLA